VRPPPEAEVLLTGAEVAAVVRRMADEIAQTLDDDAVVACLLTGAIWFAADLMRALAALDVHPLFDALWLASYGDARQSRGQIEMRAGLQRPVGGRQVLILDDVLDSGLSLAAARGHALAAGAATVLTAVFARKPWPAARALTPDFVGWEAPARFLAGYGLDDKGRFRGLDSIIALD
jgi:hypoxanthine phosphoribosyltransferase